MSRTSSTVRNILRSTTQKCEIFGDYIMEKITTALRRLDLSQTEQSVYLSLLQEGTATARILSARTSITRPSVYDQLKTLVALGLVVDLEIEGKTHFAASDLKYLDALLADKIDRLAQSRESLAQALPLLQESLTTVTPKLRFFEGSEEVKQLLKDIMWHDTTTLQIIWPVQEMSHVFDATFLNWFNERRQKRGLRVSLLLPYGIKKSEVTIFTQGEDDQYRILKKEDCKNLSMASIIYDNKVAFVSSVGESFGFIVESKEFAELERVKFNALWG